MGNLSDIKEIFERCIAGSATEEELHLLWEWIDMPENEANASRLIENAFLSAERHMPIDPDTLESIIQAVLHAKNTSSAAGFKSAANTLSDSSSTPSVHRIHFLRTGWFRYAAVLLLIVGTSTFLYKTYRVPQKDLASSNPVQQPTIEIQPGSDKAMLTLSDGSIIALDGAANGALAREGGTYITKLKSGSLVYNAEGRTDKSMYNIVSTPNGGQYQVVLPDGSKVWLNASSSIKFPTVFKGNARNVEITGEAYMEIAKKPGQVFTVKAHGTEVQVLGTSFNINSYTDEPAIKTSLIAGSVKIGTVILAPGEAYSNGKKYKANVEQDMAWKAGIFNFQNKTLAEVMRQLARWYDVDIQYPDSLSTKKFGGKMGRDLVLSQMLELLDGPDMHFALEGRKILVHP